MYLSLAGRQRSRCLFKLLVVGPASEAVSLSSGLSKLSLCVSLSPSLSPMSLHLSLSPTRSPSLSVSVSLRLRLSVWSVSPSLRLSFYYLLSPSPSLVVPGYHDVYHFFAPSWQLQPRPGGLGLGEFVGNLLSTTTATLNHRDHWQWWYGVCATAVPPGALKRCHWHIAATPRGG